MADSRVMIHAKRFTENSPVNIVCNLPKYNTPAFDPYAPITTTTAAPEHNLGQKQFIIYRENWDAANSLEHNDFVYMLHRGVLTSF